MEKRLRLLAVLGLIAAAAVLAVGSSAANTSTPAGRAQAHGVDSSELFVGVPQTAAYVGSERFELYGVADCEIHLFVEADPDRRIQRFYWIQFEGYLPSRPTQRYDYSGDGNQPMDLWGARAWVRPGIILTGRTSRAGSDTERVRAMLQRAGYVEPHDFAYARIVRLLDDPVGTGRGRRELMLIYAEDMALTGATTDDVLDDDEPNERWAPLAEALIRRAQTVFTVQTPR